MTVTSYGHELDESGLSINRPLAVAVDGSVGVTARGSVSTVSIDTAVSSRIGGESKSVVDVVVVEHQGSTIGRSISGPLSVLVLGWVVVSISTMENISIIFMSIGDARSWWVCTVCTKVSAGNIFRPLGLFRLSKGKSGKSENCKELHVVRLPWKHCTLPLPAAAFISETSGVSGRTWERRNYYALRTRRRKF